MPVGRAPEAGGDSRRRTLERGKDLSVEHVDAEEEARNDSPHGADTALQELAVGIAERRRDVADALWLTGALASQEHGLRRIVVHDRRVAGREGRLQGRRPGVLVASHRRPGGGQLD